MSEVDPGYIKHLECELSQLRKGLCPSGGGRLYPAKAGDLREGRLTCGVCDCFGVPGKQARK